MVVQYYKIHGSTFAENCYQNDRAALPRVLDRLIHRQIISRAVIDDVRFIGAEALDERFREITLLRVNADVDTDFPCFCKADIGNVCDHDFPRAQALRNLCRQDPDGTRTEDADIFPCHISRLLHGMHADCKRLDHSAFFIRHLLWKVRDLLCIHGKIPGSGTGRLEPHDLQFFAEIVFSMPAGITFSADDLRLDRDLLSDRKPCHVFSELFNDTRNLMALCHRIGCKRVRSVIHMDIGSADADIHDLHKHLALFRFRHRDLPEFDLTGGRHHFLQHHFFHDHSPF